MLELKIFGGESYGRLHEWSEAYFVTLIGECFNDWGGRGYDDSVPVEVTKKKPSGDRTTSSPHGRQACPEFNSFRQGVGQICSRRGYFRAVPSKNGDQNVTSPPPSIVERVRQMLFSLCFWSTRDHS